MYMCIEIYARLLTSIYLWYTIVAIAAHTRNIVADNDDIVVVVEGIDNILNLL